MTKLFLLSTWIIEDNIRNVSISNMTEQWGEFEELNIDTTYETENNEELQVLQSIEYLRDYGQVGDEFEWRIDPMSKQSASITRIN
tara:strand:- start:131 stop:388 length:258 start_codon:yes stop_codon:yes gene_type:complete